MSRLTLRRSVSAVLEKVGLDPSEKRQLRKFSKGMLQRVGIAQALIADPDLYIFDEPMGGLDPLGRRWLKDVIAELGKKGKTVFFSSHILSEAEAVCDRVALLRQGQLLVQGSLREILRSTDAGWEVVVEGKEVIRDNAIRQQASSIDPNGPDSLLVPIDPLGPTELLKLLLARGYRVRAVNQRHASLEEVFIRSLDIPGNPEGT